MELWFVGCSWFCSFSGDDVLKSTWCDGFLFAFGSFGVRLAMSGLCLAGVDGDVC